MRTQEELRGLAGRFAIRGNVLSVRPMGNGLINDTYRVETDGGNGYVLQRINHAVFRDVALLQHNIEAVTRHLRRKLAGDPDLDRKVLTFLPLRESEKTWFMAGDGTFWRLSVLIRDAFTHETADPRHARFAGEAFGRFEALLTDLDEPLGETIPDFHNMELRARQFHEAIRADAVGRMADPAVRALVDAVLADEEEMCKAERLHRDGSLPKRICHCDTKVNNMLFDAAGNVLCVIDLDTVMPSFVFSDFGDFLRTAANTGSEDDPNPDHVSFNMDVFEAFASGYLSAAGSFLTPVERENLPFAALLFPYMQTVRFLTDWLAGDTYYKILYPEHNRVRSFAQWKLYRSARACLPAMTGFIQNY
ncbi:MAG: aminoglycoside phosphotransferase family protein [Bacteroidales bacterium]|nr:aminoglycoside phosphotransferase family protein [Bacteroidales bacterium]